MEHRAAKVIAKIEDPAAPAMRAPMYKSDKELLDAIRESNPHLLEETTKKDIDFNSRLKDVYVTSRDPTAAAAAPSSQETSSGTSHRPLPVDRTPYSYDFIPGTMRTDPNKKPPVGRLTLTEAVNMLTSHAERPDRNTASVLSDQYRLNAELTEATLKHFRIYKMIVPEPKIRETRDPLAIGKDWVEDAKLMMEPGPGLDYTKAILEEKNRLEKLQEKRAKEQKLLEDSRPRTR